MIVNEHSEEKISSAEFRQLITGINLIFIASGPYYKTFLLFDSGDGEKHLL